MLLFICLIFKFIYHFIAKQQCYLNYSLFFSHIYNKTIL